MLFEICVDGFIIVVVQVEVVLRLLLSRLDLLFLQLLSDLLIVLDQCDLGVLAQEDQELLIVLLRWHLLDLGVKQVEQLY